MLAFPPGELDDLQTAQEGHMMDGCLLAEPTVVTDLYNLSVESFHWDAAEEQICGYDPSPRRELLDQVPDSDAVLRLPRFTEITHRARVRITHRYGVLLDEPITYDVLGAPRLGPSGLLVWLKKVTDGSDG